MGEGEINIERQLPVSYKTYNPDLDLTLSLSTKRDSETGEHSFALFKEANPDELDDWEKEAGITERMVGEKRVFSTRLKTRDLRDWAKISDKYGNLFLTIKEMPKDRDGKDDYWAILEEVFADID